MKRPVIQKLASRQPPKPRRTRAIETLESRLALSNVPTTPDELAAADSLAGAAVNVTLTWAPATVEGSTIRNYKVFRNGTLIGSPTGTTLVDAALSAAALAEYRVSAVSNLDVESALSAPIYVAQFQNGVSDGGAYSGTVDSWINQSMPAQQNGAATSLRVDGEDPNPNEDMILVQWDIASIPADADIESASMFLNVTDNSTGQNYNIYPLVAPWDETTVNFNNAAAGDPWQTAGARGPEDRVNTSMGTIGVMGTTLARRRFALNAFGEAQVERWVSGAELNNGVIISDVPNGTTNNALEFSSSEFSPAASRPLFLVVYSIATPLPPSQLTVKHTPRIQLGNAPLAGILGGETDQIEIIWQTEETGAGEDYFTVDYRHLGSSIWLPGPDGALIETGVGTRSNHSYVLGGLMFDQDYEYRVRHFNEDDVLYGTWRKTFHTRLAAGSPEAFSFVAYGDAAFGSPPTNFISVQNRINQLNPAFAVLLGDNAYGAAGVPSSEWGSQAAHDLRFDPTINSATPDFASSHVEYPTVGNADLATEDGQATADNFSVPRNGPGDDPPGDDYFSDRSERTYSFDYGNVHFATFDGSTLLETEAPYFSQQLAWLEADLLATNAPWKVVYTHYPIIATDIGRTADSPYYQQLLATLRAGGADLLLVGDSHTYQRSYPLTGESSGDPTFVLDTDNNYAKGAGLVQLVVGTGGRSLSGGAITSDPHLARARTTETNPASEFGLAKFDVVGNVLSVSYVAADDGAILDTFSITAPAPIATPAQTLPVGETVWTAAAGPRRVTGNIVVPVGATLRIEPGVDVFFNAGTGITVNGRLVAEGTPLSRITLSAPAGSTAAWAGLQFINTREDNRLVHVDMSDALSRADAILIRESRLLIDHVVWSNINGNILELDNIDLQLRNSVFPEVDAGEPIESNSGIPEWGQFVMAGNIFGRSLGNSDTVDFEGGVRTGRIMQVYGNVFYGGPDEALDFDLDAHIEGNIFMSNLESLGAPEPNGTTSAISTGPYLVPDPEDPGETIEVPTNVTITRNIFYLADQAVGIKQGTFVTFTHNTVIGIDVAALNFYDPSRETDPGKGALIEGNIFYDVVELFGHVDESPDGPNTFDTDLVMNYSLVDNTLPPAVIAQMLALGVGNIAGNPMFVNPTGDFHLLPGSPAIGTGPNGRDMGAYVSATPPSVVGVTVRGTTWSQAMMDRLVGGDGYSIPYIANPGSAPVLPWSGIDQIEVQFSERVVIAPDALSVTGENVANYQIAAFHYDVATHTATWTLTAPINEDTVLIALGDGVTDLIEAPLDGDGSSDFPSGDGTAGGEFHLWLNVLPGDANGDRTVTLDDVTAVVLASFRDAANPDYQAVRDVNADGIINVVDVIIANNHREQPPESAPAAVVSSAVRPASASSGRARLAAKRLIDRAHADAIHESSFDLSALRSRRGRTADSQ